MATISDKADFRAKKITEIERCHFIMEKGQKKLQNNIPYRCKKILTKFQQIKSINTQKEIYLGGVDPMIARLV